MENVWKMGGDSGKDSSNWNGKYRDPSPSASLGVRVTT
jgi:hypothetical protein